MLPQITLRVLDGADRGRVYREMSVPITIGREEGNAVQLNDERISRFHVKIQEDQSKLVLTDLESTNGTRVNGEDTQLRILRFGDVITVGRSVLLFGTRKQIAARLESLRGEGLAATGDLDPERIAKQMESSAIDFELEWGASENLQSTLHLPSPPELPEQLSPGQAAQVSEMLEYFHLRTRNLVSSVNISGINGGAGINGSSTNGPDAHEEVRFDLSQWQDLLDLQSQLAEYLRKIGEPGEE